MVIQAIVDTDNEMVNSPKHYLRGKHEVIEVLEAWDLPFHVSNAVKYLARCGFKNAEEEELQKCLWYLKRWQFVLTTRGESGDKCMSVHLTKTKEKDGFGINDVLVDWNMASSVLGNILTFIYYGELDTAICHLFEYVESIE